MNNIFKHLERNVITYNFGIIALICSYTLFSDNFLDNYIYSFSNFDVSKLKNDGAIVNYIIAKNTHGTKILTILAGFLGLLLAFWRSHNADRNRRNDESKEINERYTKTVELLGSDNEAVRIGALYSLEQISKESKKLYKPCLKIIESYIANEMNNSRIKTKQEEWQLRFNLWKSTYKKNLNSGYMYITNIKWDFKEQPSWYLPEDLKVALYILSSNEKSNKVNLQGLNFQGCNFVKLDFNFRNLDLSGGIFKYCKFKIGFKFINCNLQDSDFTNAYLPNVSFAEINLARAVFVNALLQCSDFKKSNLNGADFSEADIQSCRFSKAYLAYSNFYKVKMNKVLNNKLFKNVNFSGVILDNGNYNRLKDFLKNKYEYKELDDEIKKHIVGMFSLPISGKIYILESKEEYT